MVTAALLMILPVWKVIDAGPPQLNAMAPPPAWAVASAASKAVSWQLAAVPVPTTASAARRFEFSSELAFLVEKG